MTDNITQADLDCRNAIYKELTGFRVPDDIAAQGDWMDKYISAHRLAAEAAQRERDARIAEQYPSMGAVISEAIRSATT